MKVDKKGQVQIGVVIPMELLEELDIFACTQKLSRSKTATKILSAVLLQHQKAAKAKAEKTEEPETETE